MIKVGVVGVGHLGKEHVRIYSSLPGCELAGIFDVDPGVKEKFARKYRVCAVNSIEEMTLGVDAVSVVVPTSFHHEVARTFLEAGRHVFVEKPITETTSQAEDLVKIAGGSGLILQVGAWVLRTACAQLAEWDRQGLPPINLAVNLSARQLRHPYLSALVEDTLRENAIEPSRLEIELTESLAMEDTEVTRGVLGSFARIGVRLAIDDFGTGHSSLAYLRQLDVDVLKVDRSFVNQLPYDPEDCAIATAVVALGHSLHMKVVAEGVETQEQANFLRQLGCDEMQGWLLSRAKPAPLLVQWLNEYERKRRAGDKRLQYGADDNSQTQFDLDSLAVIESTE